MGDQDQGNTPSESLPKRVSDIPEAAGIEEVEVGKTRVRIDEFFGQGRNSPNAPHVGRILRTGPENDAIAEKIAEEVARRAEQQAEQRERDAAMLRELAFLEEVINKPKEERIKQMRQMASFGTGKSIDMGAVNERLENMRQAAKIEDIPSIREIVDMVMVELAKRLLTEHYEIRNTKTDKTPQEVGRAIYEAAKNLWVESVRTRAEEIASNPQSRRYNHQAVTSTLQIPVEDEEETE